MDSLYGLLHYRAVAHNLEGHFDTLALDAIKHKHEHEREHFTSAQFWISTGLPAVVAISSLFLILGKFVYMRFVSKTSRRGQIYLPEDGAIEPKTIPDRTITQKIFAFLRVVFAISQLGLLIAELVLVREQKSYGKQQTAIIGLLAVWIYGVLLSIGNLAHSKARFTFEAHLDVLYVVSFVPALVYDIQPWLLLHRDATLDYPTILSIARGVNTFILILVWIFCPRTFIPVLPHKYPNPTPEQTASVFSIATFTHMDKLIFYAWRNGGIKTPEEVYDLPDFEHSEVFLSTFGFEKNLQKRSFYKMGKRPSLAFALLRHFGFWYSVGFFCSLATTVANFLSPLFLNKLLEYLQNPQGSMYSPYVYCVGLLIAPVIMTLFQQCGLFYSTKLLIGQRAILNHLLYAKILRIREVNTDDNMTTEPKEGDNDADGKDKKTEAPEKEDTRSSRSGKINNLISVDVEAISKGVELFFMMIQLPIQLAICIWALWKLLGWAPFVGYASMIVTMPLPIYLSTRLNERQEKLTAAMDRRIALISEALQSIRITKYFAWEDPMIERINKARKTELEAVMSKNMFMLGMETAFFLAPAAILVVTFVTYTLFMGQRLTASVAFTSLTLLMILQRTIGFFSFIFGMLIRSKVSYCRIRDFLWDEEELDDDVAKGQIAHTVTASADNRVYFRDASYRWSSGNKSAAPSGPSTPMPSGSVTPSGFMLSNLNLTFPTGQLSIVAGPVGSGKTSLLMALLGEMHEVTGLAHLPGRGVPGEIAYVSQSAWLQNATIKDNILFGSAEVGKGGEGGLSAEAEARYRKVLSQCALEPDLKTFDAGDQTEVGEKGITLSGGQKQRLSLARALYSNSKILLLDDVLSAVDSHTARWIFEKCLCGDLVKDRTVILVTHYVNLCAPAAKFMVLLRNGRVVRSGAVKDVLAKEKLDDPDAEPVLVDKSEDTLSQPAAVEPEATETIVEDSALPESEEVKVVESKSGKLMIDEDLQSGIVGWSTYALYLGALGGFLFWFAYLTAMGSWQASSFGIYVWISRWVSDLASNPDADNFYYLAVYTALSLFGVLIHVFAALVVFWASVHASKVLHARLLVRVFRAPIRWFDRIPVGRIINRFSRDIDVLDTEIVWSFSNLFDTVITMFGVLIMISIITPAFIIPATLVVIVFAFIAQLYITCNLAIRRLISTHRSPIYSLVSDSINGCATIRAFGQQQRFALENEKRIDAFNRFEIYQYQVNRWLHVRSDTAGGAVAMLAGLLALFGGASPGIAGLSLSYAVQFTDNLIWTIRQANLLQLNMNSIERIEEYLDLEQEPQSTVEGTPPAAWPTDGDITVENLTVRYYPDSPIVLDDISFSIRPREKIGVVGRTGSGKSTLALTLLRFVDVSNGKITMNGHDISKLNLEALRKSISLIPQDPVLFSGTIRSNLDPFGTHDDAMLWNALKSSHLLDDRDEDEEAGSDGPSGSGSASPTAVASRAAITLDTIVADNGSNFSQGERQLLSLARALVRRNKLIIMDEATSSTDDATDTKIQQTIRDEFGTESTLITIAHRLRTIADFDRVLVLNKGKIAEFDSPYKLMTQQGGIFKSMCEQSGDYKELLAMAKAAAGAK